MQNPQSTVLRRTTLTLPSDLLAATDQLVREGKARNRNEFIALALRHELAAQKQADIDAEFAAMAGDAEYQAEALEIAHDFVRADWEALHQNEDRQ
jgi:metal-responsive CopG/Arc/MetJ family transcriptional regulator